MSCKDSKNTINSVRESNVQYCSVYNISTPLLRIWGAFFILRSIQPFNFASVFNEINQLREVITKIVYVCKFYHLPILLVPALLAETGDLNQIVCDGESIDRDVQYTQRVQGTQGN